MVLIDKEKEAFYICFWETVSFLAVYNLNFFLQSVSFPNSCSEQGEHQQQLDVLCSFEGFVCLVGNEIILLKTQHK